jgi:hypothetical protein
METIFVLFLRERNNGMLIILEVRTEIGRNFETNFILLSSLLLKLSVFVLKFWILNKKREKL